MKTTGIPTGSFKSRAAAIRAYQDEHPHAKADEIAAALGCTQHQVWSSQAADRRTAEHAARKDHSQTEGQNQWLRGFAAALAPVALASVSRDGPGKGLHVREIMRTKGVALADLALAGVSEEDVRWIRAALGSTPG